MLTDWASFPGRQGVALQGRARTSAESGFDAVAVENADGGGAFVIVCDHASNRFPPEYGFLGLDEPARVAHIAWDPGALGVSRHLSSLLDAPLVHCTVSRLVIDCNRPLDAPDLIAATSETTTIPGNANLTDADRRRRIAAVHVPFHDAIDALVEARLAAGRATALIGVHSFTRVYRGVARPWEAGLIFDRNRRLADVLIEGLRAEGLNVGVNQPYAPADRVYYTLSRHGEARGLDCAMLEIRNDLVRSDDDEAEWATRIAGILSGVMLSEIKDVRSAASGNRIRAVGGA
jgi:predicted N-formylglutamate amidohydrolase